MTDHHAGRREPPPAARPSRARRTSPLGRLAALVVAAGVALSPGTAAAAAGSAGSAAPAAVPVAATKAGLDIQLSRVSPVAVGPTTPFAVTVAVRNTGGSTLRKPTVTLRLHQGLLDGRQGVDDWVDDGAASAVDRELGRARLKTLAPGQGATVTISVAAGGLGLGTLSSFGPRGIAIDADAGGRNVGTLRSTFVWVPVESEAHTRLSLAVPLTEATASAVAGSATAEAARSLEPGGHLDRVLTATQDKAVAWAVDPAVLAAARRLSADGVTTDDALPTATGTDDPDATTGPSSSPSSSAAAGPAGDQVEQAAGSWLSRFKAGARNRGLIGLPYADPDLTATLRARESVPLLTGADELGRRAAADAAGVRLDPSIAWPAGGRINTVTASRLAGNGRTAVILAASTQPPEAALSTTPTGRGTVDTKGGSLDSLLYDDQLSALFASSGTSAGAQATQTFLAELAAITRESGTVRHLLAVAPRSWQPEPAGVQTLLAALRKAPWVSLRGINELRSTEPTVERTGVRYGTRAKNAELPIGHVSYMLALHRGLTTFAPALDVDDPETTPEDKKLQKQGQAVVQADRESIASMLSVAWRGDRQQLVATRSRVGDGVNDLVDGVQLRGGGGTLTGKSASLPLYVDNRTPYPVKVRLQLKPGSGQVAFANDLTVTVPPRQLLLPVQVPTRSLANGNVQVEARLLTDEGGEVGNPLVFTVKVRPSWETVGMIVVGSVLGLLFVLGLLRSVRRGRRRTRVHPDNVPDVDDLASERADAVPAGGGSDPGIGSTGGSSPPEPESVEPSAESGATRTAMPRETR